VSNLLAAAIQFRAPAKLATAAEARAKEYGWADVDREEASRDSARAPIMRDFTRRLVDGATITFHQRKDSLSWGYDPTALIAFDLASTIYPSGSFTAPWGTLTVERGGVLLRNDFSTIRVGGPSAAVTADTKQLAGDGWSLSLKPGWRVLPDPAKPGSYVVVHDQ
jgi:hypothetical protein